MKLIQRIAKIILIIKENVCTIEMLIKFHELTVLNRKQRCNNWLFKLRAILKSKIYLNA